MKEVFAICVLAGGGLKVSVRFMFVEQYDRWCYIVFRLFVSCVVFIANVVIVCFRGDRFVTGVIGVQESLHYLINDNHNKIKN